MTPATDGLAALAQIARYAGPGQLARGPGTPARLRRQQLPADSTIGT
jgi:hypothetical protein